MGAKKKRKKTNRGKKQIVWLQRPPPFCSFFFGPPPSPSVLFAYSFTLPPSPLLLPYQETPDCHAFLSLMSLLIHLSSSY